MVRTIVLNRQGEEIDLSELAVMQDLSKRLPFKKALEYLATNVGLIVFDPRPGIATIYLRPKRVSGPALAALYRCIAQHSPSRVDLRCYGDSGWATHLVGINFVESHLEQILAESDGALKDRIRRRSIVTASLSRHHPFLPLLDAWVNGGAAADTEFWSPVLAKRGLNSFQWTRPDPLTRQLQIVEFGNGMPSCAQPWLAHTKRLSLDDHPDRHYAAYCRETYWRAANERVPLVETMDLFVDWPTYGLVRRTFHRILLNINAPGGPLLLGATLFDPTIDLRKSAG